MASAFAALMLAVTIAGCASTPTIHTHEQADRADAEMYDVLNQTIDATGGPTAWRYWMAKEPLDGPLTRGLASTDCVPRDWAGFSGHSLGQADGAYIETVRKQDPGRVVATVKQVWADAGYRSVDTDRANGQTYVRATRDDLSPTVSVNYNPDGGKPVTVTLRAYSLCESYDDE